MIVVDRVAADGLSRERWEFTTHANGYGDPAVNLILQSYRIERRDMAKGRFRGSPPQDRWNAGDERSYTSGLSRPKTIPDDVRGEAVSKIEFRFYVRSTRPENEVTK